MKTRFKLVAAVLALTVAAPAGWYLAQFPSSDPLADKLYGYDFHSINPPSTLVDVGSLYYVSQDGRAYQMICRADPSDLKDVVQKSPSVQIRDDLKQQGSFASDISVRLPALLRGGFGNDYEQKVHYSVTDVTIEEIPLVANKQIQTKLMDDARCNEVVLEQLRAGAFVCQPQRILLATVEYKLDRETENKLKVSADVKPDDVNQAVKTAITSQSDQSVVEKDGRLFSGSALNYGVAFNPTCISPPHANFARVLPWTRFGEVVNFISYHLIEPLLPPTPDAPAAVAQAALPVTR